MTSLMKCLHLNSLCCPPPHRVIEKCRGQEARRKSRDTTQDLSAREQSAIRCQAAAGAVQACARVRLEPASSTHFALIYHVELPSVLSMGRRRSSNSRSPQLCQCMALRIVSLPFT
jgi:hypothetical protein